MAGSKTGTSDKGMEELRAQLKQITDDVNRRFAEEAEKSRLREAQTQELLVSTIIDQLKIVREQVSQAVTQEVNDRMAVFESRFEKINRDTNGKQVDEGTHSNMVLTNNRRPMGTEMKHLNTILISIKRVPSFICLDLIVLGLLMITLLSG